MPKHKPEPLRPKELRFGPIDRKHALELVSWKYPPPYDVYNHAGDRQSAAVENFLLPGLNYFLFLANEANWSRFVAMEATPGCRAETMPRMHWASVAECARILPGKASVGISSLPR